MRPRLAALRFGLTLAIAFALAAAAPLRAAADDEPGGAATDDVHGAAAGAETSFEAVDLNAALTPVALADRLRRPRVVFVGETHARYDHHLNQLEIIRALHESGESFAIGVEYLERRVQPSVDDYIEGRISEREFLRATEYFRSWGYDYRLYAPIFRYAREEHIPVRALNVPRSLPAAVARAGIAGLTDAQRAELPKEMAPAGEAYEARLRRAFEAHDGGSPGGFQHFVDAQLVWDEGMAESAAAYLDANPGQHMVILAGAGHVEFGSGIPSRLARRTGASYAIVLGTSDDVDARASDYLLLGPTRDLPPAGALGVRLEDEDGKCAIRSVRAHGAADAAGLEEGDALVSIDAAPVSDCADARIELWDKRPGDRVRVEVQRSRLFKSHARTVEVELEAAER